jgi:hypothetical protein
MAATMEISCRPKLIGPGVRCVGWGRGCIRRGVGGGAVQDGGGGGFDGAGVERDSHDARGGRGARPARVLPLGRDRVAQAGERTRTHALAHTHTRLRGGSKRSGLGELEEANCV